jgi:hypothetical protein
MLATPVGLSLVLALVGGTSPWPVCCWGAGCRLARPAATRSRPPPASGPARPGGWPPSGRWPRPSASVIGLWTRQHRFPTAELVVVDQGVTATVAAMAGAGLADYQQAAGYLADTWGYVRCGPSSRRPG